jgi:hypothetical protein
VAESLEERRERLARVAAESPEERRERLARKKHEEEQWAAYWAAMQVDFDRGRRDDGCRIMPLIFEDEE